MTRHPFPYAVRVLAMLAAPAVVAAQPAEPTPPPEVPPGAATDAPAPGPPPPAPAPPAPKPRKGLVVETPDGTLSMKLGMRLQPFYVLTRTSTPTDFRSLFEVRRARVILEGHLYRPTLTYKFQADFGRGFLTLKDFVLDAELAAGVHVRAGQWKRPFSRQQIGSTSRMNLSERAITDRAFGAGRDIGVGLSNSYEQSPAFEWAIGVFNGVTADRSTFAGDVVVDPITGEGEVEGGAFTNLPREVKPAVVARVGLNRGGIAGYDETGMEGGGLRYGVAASVWLEGDYDEDDASQQKLQLDAIVKAHGFATTGAVYAMMEQNGRDVGEQQFSLLGFHVQAGYMVAPKHLEAAVRYALVRDQITGGTTARDQEELGVGVNYTPFGHHDVKLMSSLRFLEVGEASFTDLVVFEVGTNLQF